MNSSLVITYSLAALPDDPYWLTIEQQKADDAATVEDVAKVVDSLYNIDPCIAAKTETTDPTQEDLVTAAHAVDYAMCKQLKSGEYTADVKIIRSHPDLPYKLVLDVGKVTKTVRKEELLTVTLDVQGASSLVLESPVVSGLSASWLGRPYTSKGIAQTLPPIKARHNTLFWEGSYTGTLRVQYNTTYDLVSIKVPGKMPASGDVAEAQTSHLLVFYHYQAYTGTVDPPQTDTSADETLMAQVCGWATAQQLLELAQDKDKPLPEAPSSPDDPCLDHPESSNSAYNRNYLSDPRYYEDTCCHPPSWALPTCRRLVSGRVKTKGLDQETKDSFPEGTKFIAVGPDPKSPEGCGRIIKTIDDTAIRCCDLVTRLVWDLADSVSVMTDGSWGSVFWDGGWGLYTVTANGTGFWMDAAHTKKSIRTADLQATVYTLGSCGTCVLTVTDACGQTVAGRIRSTVGRWVEQPGWAGSCDSPLAGSYAGTFYGQGTTSWWTVTAEGYQVDFSTIGYGWSSFSSASCAPHAETSANITDLPCPSGQRLFTYASGAPTCVVSYAEWDASNNWTVVDKGYLDSMSCYIDSYSWSSPFDSSGQCLGSQRLISVQIQSVLAVRTWEC